MKSGFRAAAVLSAIFLSLMGCSAPARGESDVERCIRTAPHLSEQEFRKYAPYQTYSLQTEGAVAELNLSPTGLPVRKPDVSEWVGSAAKAVA
ncbi:MAG TPA: hypothetical protein VKU80_14625, partial [Planctomycetota bacterium]|nr:hypothetical protein [Planctomycetota bacterium]